MSVAIYIKSESGDEYLYLYEKNTLDDIKFSLNENIEMFEPIANYKMEVKGKHLKDEKDLKSFLLELHEKSWRER